MKLEQLHRTVTTHEHGNYSKPVSEIGVENPEVVVVVGHAEGQLRARSFAAPSGLRAPQRRGPVGAYGRAEGVRSPPGGQQPAALLLERSPLGLFLELGD